MISRSCSAVVGLIAAWWASVCERARLRLSAALMDAGAYLALDPIERRARKIRRRLRGRKGRRLGPYRALLAMNADELAGEATLVLGRRATPSGRIHTLLCVATGEGSSTPEAARPSPGRSAGEVLRDHLEGSEFYWAVRTQRADAPRGLAGARTSMLHEREGALEKALVAFFADPVSPGFSRSQQVRLSRAARRRPRQYPRDRAAG